MLEIFRDILSIFVEMLGVEYKVSTDILVDIKELESIISKLLRQGKKADKMIHPQITPLMLYAAFNITDERFTDLINSPIYELGIVPFPNFSGISALTLAASNGCLDTLSALIATEQFTQEHIEEAAFIAASMGQAEVITLVHSLNYNILKPCVSGDLNSLYAACIAGHKAVVAAILATIPQDELNLSNLLDDSIVDLAYDLALTQNQVECATLLKQTRRAIYHEFTTVIEENNLERLDHFLAEKNMPYLFIHRGESLSGTIAATAVLDNNYTRVFDYIFNHLDKLPAEEQVNTLLISLSSYIHEFRGELPQNSAFFQKMLQKLKSLEPYYNEINMLMLNGLSLNDSIWEAFMEIVKTNKPSFKSIHFKSMSDNFLVTDDHLLMDDYLLLKMDYLVELIPLLLTNTRITEINVFRDTDHLPLAQVLDLIIERNRLIESSPLPLTQDKIYNFYVPKINALLRQIKHYTTIQGTDKYEELKEKQHVYTLKQLSAFFIQSSMSQQMQQSCPKEVEEYIAQTALPKLPH